MLCQANLVLQVLQDFSDGLQTQMLLPNLQKRQKVSALFGFKFRDGRSSTYPRKVGGVKLQWSTEDGVSLAFLCLFVFTLPDGTFLKDHQWKPTTDGYD